MPDGKKIKAAARKPATKKAKKAVFPVFSIENAMAALKKSKQPQKTGVLQNNRFTNANRFYGGYRNDPFYFLRMPSQASTQQKRSNTTFIKIDDPRHLINRSNANKNNIKWQIRAANLGRSIFQ